MDDNCGEWVESMGVAIRRWVWLECKVVVSGCCYKEVYRFPHITYPYSTCIIYSSVGRCFAVFEQPKLVHSSGGQGEGYRRGKN